MSAAVSHVMLGRCEIIIGVKGCKKCGVEFSDSWAEQKVWIIIDGRRHQVGVPICAGCSPFLPPVPVKGRSV